MNTLHLIIYNFSPFHRMEKETLLKVLELSITIILLFFNRVVHRIAYTGNFRIKKKKQKRAAFQEYFGQRFGCQDTKPLTYWLKGFKNHTLPYTSSLTKIRLLFLIIQLCVNKIISQFSTSNPIPVFNPT